jgi:hypothetical protein
MVVAPSPATVPRSIPRRAGIMRSPMSMVGSPPMSRDERLPNSWATQPTRGPPMRVVPPQASAHSAITRPRIEGTAASCSAVLACELNVTLP